MIAKAEYERVATELLPTLYKIAFGILRSDADARDAVQQALLKAWEKRDTAREGLFRAFLTRILINECRNIQRQRMRVFPAPLDALPMEAPPDYRELYEAIYALPDKLRLPVWLKYLENYSEQEAARALGVSVSAFKSRLHRARKTLRAALEREVTFE